MADEKKPVEKKEEPAAKPEAHPDGKKSDPKELIKKVEGKVIKEKEDKQKEIEKKEILQRRKEEDKKRQKKAKKISSHEQKRRFTESIKKAGIESNFDEVNTKIMKMSVVVLGVYIAVMVFIFIKNHTYIFDAIKLLFLTSMFGIVLAYFLTWGAFFLYVDYQIYNRKKLIELVFPEFLQLTAANIHAGMPIDRALWYAIRPRFGILAKEMESVAKSTIVGENIRDALTEFSNKYDSAIVKRSVNLLLEGIDSGGEIGDLLIKVANNIGETEIMKKEMASNVMTYVIFILFATIGMGPFLFGLTTELIVIMKRILGDVMVGAGTGSATMGFSMSADGISVGDYKIFAVVSVILGSTFASVIINIIQKGSAKESVRVIPIFVLIGLVVYFASFNLLNLVLSSLF